jgi:CRP-like cAMP-binding protein
MPSPDPKQFPERAFLAGEALFRQGEPSDCMYILLEGRLVVVEDGVRIATIDEPGSSVGEISLLLGSPRMADVRADTDCRLRLVQDLEAWIRDDPGRCIEIARDLARRLNQMDRRFLEMRQHYKDAGGQLDDEDADALPPMLQAFKGYLRTWRVNL